jgi:enamine deaminase RidA (YjgF/YER057c/UK114 family)
LAIAARLRELNIEIPAAAPGKLAPAVRTGNLVFTSGQVSTLTGKVGTDVTTEQAYQAAREVILRCLGAVQWAVGDLEKVTRVVKLLGMVNCGEGFTDTPSVIHGATDTLVEIFGQDIGWHARSAVGLYQLPGNVSVEIELIVEVRG